MARNFRLYPSGCFVLFFYHLFPPECELCLWLCSTWQINSRIYWISLIHHQALILQSYLVLWYLLFNENITPMFMIEKIKFTEVIQQSLCDAVKEKHWWWDFSIRKYWTSVGGFFLRITPAKRAPYGWCMGAIFVQKRWSRASPFFFGGNSSCLAALIQAGWLYLHTYSNKAAWANSRKGSRFVCNRSLATELKQADATSCGWTCIWAGARHVFPSSY